MSFIDLSQEGAVAVITFNRPEMGNAFTRAMYRDCCDALRSFEDDDSVNVVVLRGEGRDFCTGNDLNEFVAADDLLDLDHVLDRQKTASTDIVHLYSEFRKPLIAAVQGRSVGWGATMQLHCDVVIGEETARILYKFVKMGLVPEGAATRLLKERVGMMRASRILLSGATVDAQEALNLGLFAEVVPEGDAFEKALEMAQDIAANPPGAVQATKCLMRDETTSLAQQIDAEFTEFVARLRDPESQTIMRHMLRK